MKIKKALVLGIGTLLMVGLHVTAGSRLPDPTLLYTTVDGRILSSVPAGIPVWPVPPLISVGRYDISESSAAPMGEPTIAQESGSTRFWGYEAARCQLQEDNTCFWLDGRLLEYTIGSSGQGPVSPVGECEPDPGGNGRGVAFDPLDGNLWYARLDFPPSFSGDGFIHKAAPPSSGCTNVNTIPFGDGPGGTIQDDIGAMDVDASSKHIWVAGYRPIVVGTLQLSYFYLVNRNNGNIMRYCAIDFGGGGLGNDSLTFAHIGGLPGSGDYLLTDAGQNETTPNSLAVIDTADCRGGAKVFPVTYFNKTADMSGIDFEWMGLEATSVTSNDPDIAPPPPATLRNHGGPPFSAYVVAGAWGNTNMILDVTACGFRARLGGGGSSDGCPYP